MLPNGSSDNEKARAINSILNDEFFSKIDERPVYIRQYYSKGRGASISFDAEKLVNAYQKNSIEKVLICFKFKSYLRQFSLL